MIAVNDDTRKILPIKRRVRVEELEVYLELQRVADRAEVLGDDIKTALQEIVTRAGEVKIIMRGAA